MARLLKIEPLIEKWNKNTFHMISAGHEQKKYEHSFIRQSFSTNEQTFVASTAFGVILFVWI